VDIIVSLEAVQQSKIGRKREENRASNPKRSKIFGVKSNCGTASPRIKMKFDGNTVRKSKHSTGVR